MTALSPATRSDLSSPAAVREGRRRPLPSGLASKPTPEVAVEFTHLQTGAAIMLGALALLMSGVMPLFLGALADEHRLTSTGIGRLATMELLSAAASTGLAGLLLKPRGLRGLGAAASFALVLANLGAVGLHGGALTLMRMAAGAPEGVLLWLVVGLIARTKAPDFISGVLFTAMAGLQLVFAVVMALFILPKTGSDGGYVAVAALTALGMVAAFALPRRYGPPPTGEQAGLPPLRGWLALTAAFVFQAAIAGVGVYILPLAQQAGASAADGQTAVSAALAMEVVGALAATAVAGKVKLFAVFRVGGLALLAALGLYALQTPGWVFILASAVIGFFSLLVLPFFVALTIHADPSRRTAVQIGGAQLLGGALGPVLASLFVGDHDVRSALGVSAVLLVVSLSTIFLLSRPTGSRRKFTAGDGLSTARA